MATFCIAIGTLAGFISLFYFYKFNLAIFGFNIGLILSPLIAGYVETYIAEKTLGETTGAVSAFILFIVTVIYGFIIINKGFGLNIVTIGISVVILQAAFPILVNYFFIVVVLGVISYIFGFFERILEYIWHYIRIFYFKILGKPYVNVTGKMDYNEQIANVDINKLGILFLSVTSLPKEHVKEYKGIIESKISLKDHIKIINQDPAHHEEILINHLQKAREQALTSLAKKAKKENCDAIIGLKIEFNRMGGFRENHINIVVEGTGVKLQHQS